MIPTPDRGTELAGRVAIVTGASSGIGLETARALGRRGARVVLAARRLDVLLSLERELRAAGIEAMALRTDVTREADINNLVDETVARWGAVDIVIANAGVLLRRPIARTTSGDYERLMEVNFLGVVRLVLRVLPRMLERGRGHLVVVSTVDAKKGLPPEGVYVASKFALVGFCDVLRQELRGTGVSLTTVLPGRVNTEMIARLRVPAVSPKIPPDRVARAIIRGIRRKRAEVVVPFLGPKVLIVAAAIWAPLGDYLVRLFKLGGEEGTS